MSSVFGRTRRFVVVTRIPSVLQWVPHQGVVLSVQLGCQASVHAVRSAWCGRATTRKDSISSSTSPPGWESCRIRVAWGRVRA